MKTIVTQALYVLVGSLLLGCVATPDIRTETHIAREVLRDCTIQNPHAVTGDSADPASWPWPVGPFGDPVTSVYSGF